MDDVAPTVFCRERTRNLFEYELEEGRENSPLAGNRGVCGGGGPTGRIGEANHSSYFQVVDCDGSVEITKRVRMG